MEKIRVLVVDDHPLMRDALRSVIQDEADMEVAGESSNGNDAVNKANELKPDVIIMDLLMPGKDGLSTIIEIRQTLPKAHILALTSLNEEEKVLAAVQAGALGYLTKDIQRLELLQAIRTVSKGQVYLPPAMAGKLFSSLQQKTGPEKEVFLEHLTPKEMEVLRMVGEGASNREIAQSFSVTEGTVRTHIHNILQKLGLKNRNQMLLYALKRSKLF